MRPLRRTMISAFALTTLLFAGGACASSAAKGASAGVTTSTTSTTADTVATAEFTTYHDAANNFSIGTPSDWSQVSLSDPRAQAAIDQLVAQNPKLAATLGSSATLAASGIKFLAVDPSGGSTVNVAVQSAPGTPDNLSDSDLEEAVPDLTQGLKSSGASVTGHQIVTVNGRKAIEIQYDLPLTNGGTAITVHGNAYVFPTNDTVHTVSVVGTDDVVAHVMSTFTIT